MCATPSLAAVGQTFLSVPSLSFWCDWIPYWLLLRASDWKVATESESCQGCRNIPRSLTLLVIEHHINQMLSLSPVVEANHEACDCLGWGNQQWQAWGHVCGQRTGYLVHDHTTPFHRKCKRLKLGPLCSQNIQSALPSSFWKLLLLVGLWRSFACIYMGWFVCF